MAVWDLGRWRQAYVKDESTYATAPTFASTDAIRFLSLTLPYNPQNLSDSPARSSTHPGILAKFRGRRQASWEGKAMLYPSGTLNTLPEANVIIKNAFGAAATNITLSTTVASGAATTGAVVASATGLAVGQMVQVGVLGGAAPGVYARMLTGVSGTTLVWAPALPATCAVSDTVKGCVTYAPATAVTPTSMDIASYPQSPANWYNREMLGCIADKLTLDFDGNGPGMLTVGGPASKLAASPQAQPGSFTTVGAENVVPLGLYGYFQYGAVLYQVEKAQFMMVNNYDTQNTALGTDSGVAPFRKGKRVVTVKIDAKVSTDLTLWTPSIAPGPTPPTEGTMMLQLGTTATDIWAVYCPRVIFNAAPSVSDSDETNQWSFDCQALPTAGNDEIFLANC